MDGREGPSMRSSRSVAACAVGYGGQDIGSGGEVAAVAESGGVGVEEVLRARHIGVAGEYATRIEVERIGGGDAVFDQREVESDFVQRRRLILF